VRLLRSYRKLLLYPQQIVNSVQNSVLPLDVILQPEDSPSRAGVQCRIWRNGRFLTRDNGQTSLQLRPRLSEELYRLLPGERARGEDEPLRRVGGGNLEREYVCARHVTHVDVQRRKGGRGIVPGNGTIRCAVDESVDEPIRASRDRVIDLTRAEGPVDERWVDRRQVQIWVGALEIARGAIREALRDDVDEETGCAGLERLFDRL
jgi:hypothetical protein